MPFHLVRMSDIRGRMASICTGTLEKRVLARCACVDVYKTVGSVGSRDNKGGKHDVDD